MGQAVPRRSGCFAHNQITMAYTKHSDRELLEAALVGYQHQITKIDERMAEIRQQLGVGGGAAATGSADGRRHVSDETRARMAAAQQQRWAEVKRAGKPTHKRNMSAEGKARIADATRKRWAAYRAQKAAQA